MYPKISVNLRKIKENAQIISDACRRNGLTFSPVVKGVCADERIISALGDAGIHSLADSRLYNIDRISSHLPKMLVRIGDPRQAEDIVRLCDYSLQSEIRTIEALGEAAQKLQKLHKVILMIDLGDLREGLMYNKPALIKKAAKAICDGSYLRLEGIGVNLTCFGGVLPDADNMHALVSIAAALRTEFNIALPLLSGGNSSSLGLLLSGSLPQGINHLRIGEGLLLGRDTALDTAITGMHQDAFTLSAVLGELQTKPSKPIGTSGLNAFGEAVHFEDVGPMCRGICLVGRQDIDADTLRPRDPRIKVLGASSDHLLLNMSGAPESKLGSPILFDVGYGSLLRAYTSPYVSKEYEGEVS